MYRPQYDNMKKYTGQRHETVNGNCTIKLGFACGRETGSGRSNN